MQSETVYSPLKKLNAFAYAQAIWDFGVGVRSTKIHSRILSHEQSFSFTLENLTLFKTI